MYNETVKRIEEFLKENGVMFKKFEHEPVITSKEANSLRAGYSLSQGTKALLVKGKKGVNEKIFMVVVPGDKKFNVKKIRLHMSVRKVRFLTQDESDLITGGVLFGGIPPFGNIFGLDVLVDRGVFMNEEIIFNAGDRRVSIAIKPSDWKRLVNPIVADICD